MVVRTTKSPRVFAINPDQKEIDINQRIAELEKIIKDKDLKLMLGLIKDKKELIEKIFIEVKQKAIAENEEEPNDGSEAVDQDEERLDLINVNNVADVITKLGEKTDIEYDDFYEYFQTNYSISTLSNYIRLTNYNFR